MISALDLNYDVLKSMMGIIVEIGNPSPKEGEPIQLYIPILMPNISKSIPTKKVKFINKGTKLFINDIGCKPKCKTILNTQNYLTGCLERNFEWGSGGDKVDCYAPNGKFSRLLFNNAKYL